MRIRNLAALAAAASLAVAPVAAQQTRTSAPVGEAEEIFGAGNLAGAALGIVIAAALVWGFVELTNDDEPTSP